MPSHGPTRAKVMLIAEAPGSEESAKLRPLVGPSGWELRRMLSMIGMNLDGCYKANVFSRQPAENNLHLYCTDDAGRQFRALGPLASTPIGWMDREHEHELVRLYGEIESVAPNIIIALGNTACWALGLGLGIRDLRGSIHKWVAPSGRTIKVLPTYHPAAVIRQYSLRPTVLSDLEKAHGESFSPAIEYDNTELWINPTLADLEEFDALYMRDARICAADIETKRGQIDCLSFSPDPSVSLTIPFWTAEHTNYWPTAEEEFAAWKYPIKWLERPDLTKVFQNGLYDLQYLKAMCTPRACTEDTMLQHHSLYSEMSKGLGYLGSVYTNSPSWKGLIRYRPEEHLKRDD